MLSIRENGASRGWSVTSTVMAAMPALTSDSPRILTRSSGRPVELGRDAGAAGKSLIVSESMLSGRYRPAIVIRITNAL